MGNWLSHLTVDPLPALLSINDPALSYLTRRDLLSDEPGPPDCLWELSEPRRILKKQQADGSWLRSRINKHPAINPALIETWRYVRILVEKYAFSQAHPQAARAAEYLFSCQSADGDFRGMLANQYATYYTGAILSTLIQAGYVDDPRVEKGMQWLLAMRQDDGGWSIPILTHYLNGKTLYRVTSEFADPLEPDRSQPFAHNWTGMALRAFAAHPRYRETQAAKTAASLLKSRFFQPDSYTSYHAASYWLRFEYPYWWNHLVSALDAITLIGASGEDGQIQKAVGWLAEHQEADGLWKASYARPDEQVTAKSAEMRPWIGLAICRVFKRLYG